MKWPHSRFCGVQKHTTANFSISFLTSTSLPPLWFRDDSLTLNELTRSNNRELVGIPVIEFLNDVFVGVAVVCLNVLLGLEVRASS